MKATGVTRCVDDLGRIVIPVEIRNNLGLINRDKLEIYLDNESIVYRKYKRGTESHGLIRGIDHLGRVTVPKVICKRIGIDEKTSLEMFVQDDTFILRKYAPNGGCALCGEVSDKMTTHERTGKQVCHECVMSPVGRKYNLTTKGNDHERRTQPNA